MLVVKLLESTQEHKQYINTSLRAHGVNIFLVFFNGYYIRMCVKIPVRTIYPVCMLISSLNILSIFQFLWMLFEGNCYLFYWPQFVEPGMLNTCCFFFPTVINNTAMNILVHIILHQPLAISSGSIPERGIHPLHFNHCCQTAFQKGCANLQSLQQGMRLIEVKWLAWD